MLKKVRFTFSKKGGESKKKNLPLDAILIEGFVELLGETAPKLTKDLFYSTEKSGSVRPIFYEYVWSVGMRGEGKKWCKKLDKDDSIVVQLIFDEQKSRFSVREISADLKQLPPFKKERKVVDWGDSLRAGFGAFGKGLENLGVAFPGKLISTISEMKLNTVSTRNFPWWIKTFAPDLMPGVEWHISRSYLDSVGNRFLGTLVVCFLDSSGSNNRSGNSLNIEIRAFLKESSKWGVLSRLFSKLRSEKELFITTTKKEDKGLSKELYDVIENENRFTITPDYST